MAMNVGGDGGDEDEVVSAINTTPLVDVMLVLLIIFLITIPVVTHTVPVDAAEGDATSRRRPSPRTSTSRSTRTATSSGTSSRSPNIEALVNRLKKVAVNVPQPEVQIRGDGGARYEYVGPGGVRVPARRHRQDRLHHRTAAARRLRAAARPASRRRDARPRNETVVEGRSAWQ